MELQPTDDETKAIKGKRKTFTFIKANGKLSQHKKSSQEEIFTLDQTTKPFFLQK